MLLRKPAGEEASVLTPKDSPSSGRGARLLTVELLVV